jgi:hypothetical protein
MAILGGWVPNRLPSRRLFELGSMHFLIAARIRVKMNLKKKIYLYANSTTQWCPEEIIQIFQIEDFFKLPPVSTNFQKIQNRPNGAWGKLKT